MSTTDAARPRFHVTIEPAGWRFEADPERPLLASARAAGIAMPAMCRNGDCRICRCRTTRGTVTYRIEWPGLFAEERADGWILPCVAHPSSDLTIEQPEAERLDAATGSAGTDPRPPTAPR